LKRKVVTANLVIWSWQNFLGTNWSTVIIYLRQDRPPIRGFRNRWSTATSNEATPEAGGVLLGNYSLRGKRFRRVFRRFEAFFAFWLRKNWGERKKV